MGQADKEKADKEKARSRILRFLAKGTAAVADATARDKVLLDAGERGMISAERKLVAEMVRAGELRIGGGKVALAIEKRPPENFRDIGAITISGDGQAETVAVNWSESPLGQLMRRRGRDGEAFLTASEFQAGERLRADYTRGQIMPRLGANWEASGIADLTDSALAARIRVENAVRAVGPELSGILIDVCCFLKGMETVEMERGWPVRSAKIVLKTALGVLSRHYNPRDGRERRTRQTLHWGAADYRPSIS
jgi:hypothetical protein